MKIKVYLVAKNGEILEASRDCHPINMNEFFSNPRKKYWKFKHEKPKETPQNQT